MNRRELLLGSVVVMCPSWLWASPCEWCGGHEAPAMLPSEMVLASQQEPGEALVIEGVVTEADGKTPAANIVLYAYHTNAEGYYRPGPHPRGNERRHGHLRGWLKTDAQGRYRIVTIKPAPYPGRDEPAHIHITLTPPGQSEYWIDEVWFDDDPLVTNAKRQRANNIGGSGIVHLQRNTQGVWQGVRNILLKPVRGN